MRSRQGWLALGLATVFALSALVAPVAWKARLQWQAAQAVTRAGGIVRYDCDIISRFGPIQTWLATQVSRPVFANLVDVQFGIAYLNGPLFMSPPPPAPHELHAALDQLARMGSLESLSIGPVPVDSATLERISRLQTLSSLTMRINQQANLAPLRQLAALESLDLSSSQQITRAALEQLSRLPSLENLDLCATDIRGSSLECFRDFPRLELLNLDHTGVMVGDLARLADAPRLHEVTVSQTFGREALDRLNEKMPRISVIQPEALPTLVCPVIVSPTTVTGGS